MKNLRKYLGIAGVSVLLLTASLAAQAIPALQLGPGSDPNWVYQDETWELEGGILSGGDLYAYANAKNIEGGNGGYAWETAGAGNRYAYLVVSAIPKSEESEGDIFDITVDNNGVLSIFDSGVGTPPIEDPNSLSPHGIFPTYFEIYQFQFDGAIVDITDQQPGEGGTGKGYAELFDVTINSLGDDVVGIHFDLFTVMGDGTYTPGQDPLNDMVEAFAPWSHDASFVPEPAPLALMGIGLLALVFTSRRQRSGI